jgi:hypothetical protein
LVNHLRDSLRKVTARLSAELANPQRDCPAWTDFEWRIALAVTTIQGLAALLAATLQWRGPDLWERFLREQSEQTRARYQRLGQLLGEIDLLARKSALAMVALKGAALRSHGLYAQGERPTGDIDLLVNPDDLERAVALLQACGYVQSLVTSRHLEFAPPRAAATSAFGEHVDHPIKIELHTRIAEKLPVTEADITQRLFPAQPQPGLNRYRSTAALMMHLLLHGAGNIRARALRMIQLHDIALLSRRMSTEDWSEMLGCEPGRRACWWAYPPLLLTARYFPGAIPADVIATLERRCPWLLRIASRRHLLADVSWSNVRIAAFPGIEWSRTPWEALRFMKGRILPDRRDLAVLKQVTANDPAARRIHWYGLSHGTRIRRWLLSRPPRVQTMHAVRSALEYVAPQNQEMEPKWSQQRIAQQPIVP